MNLDLNADWDKAEIRFCRKINTDGPLLKVSLGKCWEWVGATSSSGYGSVRVNKVGYSAHVLAFLFANGYIPEPPFEVMHKCDNRKCVNPDHLEEGTRKQNIQDCVKRGRHSSLTHPERLPRGDQHFHDKKTHCPKGHEYVTDNVYITNNGASRTCKKCAKERAKQHKINKRGRL